MDQIKELLERGVVNILPNRYSLEKLLRSGKKLNIYLGIDPTSTKIHLGHAVALRKLQQFALLGHKVTFLIGDFTALIGDTSDKDSERPTLTYSQIKQNFKTYKKQAEKFLDFTKVTIKYNSHWLKKLNFKDIINLCRHFSAGDFYSRELIRKRLSEGKRVGLHELLYPVMQGYDSYFLDTDIQLGGTDQTFNMQAGRTLLKDLKNKESFIIANSFLTGIDGRKMSKTWNNAIWIEDHPHDIYGKVMSLKDDLILEYFTLATKFPLSEIEKINKQINEGRNPMDIKKRLAFQIVSELHNIKAAQEAQDHFEKTVQQKEIPNNTPLLQTANSELSIIDLLIESKLAFSKSEARRLIQQGGVELNGIKITNYNQIVKVQNNAILKAGKRKYIRLLSKN